MGTSADFSGPTGGAWTTYKMASANFVRYKGEKQRSRVLATFARAVAAGGQGTAGGSVGSAGGSVAGGAVVAGQSLAGFGADLVNRGLDAALRGVGLDDLIGKERFDVLGGLLDKLIGDGSTIDEVHAKSALNDAIGQLFPEDAQTYDDMADTAFDATGLKILVETFIGEYVFSKMNLILGKHLQKCTTLAEQQQLADDVRSSIDSLITINTRSRDILQIDWRGTEGKGILDAVADDVQRGMEAESE